MYSACTRSKQDRLLCREMITDHALEVVNYSLVVCLVEEEQAAACELARTRFPCRNKREIYLYYR